MPLSSRRKGSKPARSKTPIRRPRTPAEKVRRAQYLLTFRMVEALGVHPIYRHGLRRATETSAVSRDWARRAAEWVQQNQPRFTP